MTSYIRRSVSVFIFTLFVCLFLSPVIVHAQGVSHGYLTDDTGLKPGMVVQLDGEPRSDNPVKVKRGEIVGQDKIIGLATSPSDSFALIASSNESVYVQTSGEVMALVSDINGIPKDGDQLTISPLNGILMRSEGTNQLQFGAALQDFPPETQEYQIDAGSSNLSTANVTLMRINLNARSFASSQFDDPPLLTSISQSLLGRDVGPARVIIALLIFITVLVAEGGIIYGAISSAITSLGRNPLAKKDIRFELLRVLVIAIIVLAIGLSAVYAILWL